MDELGFLESDAIVFKRTVLSKLAANIPVFGVLRQGDVPWLACIKRNPKVTLFNVDEKNRDSLPQVLATSLSKRLK